MVFDQLKFETDIRYSLDRQAVYTRLGYKKEKTQLSQKVFDRIEGAFQEAEKLIETKGAYIIRRIQDRGKMISLQNSSTTIRAQSARVLLKNSFAVIFMAVTIGSGLENLAGQCTEENQFERALVLDTIGSEAAEASADAFNSYLLTQTRQTKQTLTRRFSPGYGDLPLSFQKDLFRELSLADIGIVLDKMFILSPKKTVTAILGVEE